MDVLFYTMQFGPGYGQGTERYVRMLADGLRARGHGVRIVAGDPLGRFGRRRPGELRHDDPPVHHAPTFGLTCVLGRDADAWDALLRRWRPDLVHVANPAQVGVGLIHAARRRGIPVVCTIMDYWWLCPKHTLFCADGTMCDGRVTWTQCLHCLARSDVRGWVRSAARLPAAARTLLPVLYFGRALLRGTTPAELARWTHRQRHLLAALDAASAVIFPSQAAEALIGPHIRRPRKVRIAYGIEPRWFEARVAVRPRPTPREPEALSIGFAGALEPHKGPDLLLAALRTLGWRRTRVRLAGPDGPGAYMQRLRALADGLRVEFVGPVASERMPAFLRELDLLVFTSRWPENLPILVLEALAAGVPVVAARIAGVGEVLPDAALLFEPDDAADLARTLRAWLEAPRSAWSDPALCTVETMVRRTHEIYVQAVESAAAAASP